MLLFFDTETTGLPLNWKAPVDASDNWPRVIQLAWLVTDAVGTLLDKQEFMIKPDGFTIPAEAAAVHGITTEMASRDGVPAEGVFRAFYESIARAEMLVAHNMSFDSKVMGAEFLRLGLENVIQEKKTYCTMLSTTDLCRLPGKYGYKWPTLKELHEHLFDEGFEGEHDALADIEACMRCYFELKKDL